MSSLSDGIYTVDAQPGLGPPGFEWVSLRGAPEQWDELTAGWSNPFHRTGVLKVNATGRLWPIGIVHYGLAGPVPVIGGLWDSDNATFSSLSFVDPKNCAVEPGALIEWLSQQGCKKVRFGSFFQGLEAYRLPKEGVRTCHRLEFIHDLGMDETTWWQQLRTHHRRRLKKASRAGFQLRPVRTRQGLTLTALSKSWAERRGIKGPWMSLARSLLRNARMARILSRHGEAMLYGLYDTDGRLLSVAYMLESNSCAYYMSGASSELGYRNGASIDLFWQLAREYRERGLATLNLGGVPEQAVEPSHPEHGVYRFKHGFGLEPAVRTTWIAEVAHHGRAG